MSYQVKIILFIALLINAWINLPKHIKIIKEKEDGYKMSYFRILLKVLVTVILIYIAIVEYPG